MRNDHKRTLGIAFFLSVLALFFVCGSVAAESTDAPSACAPATMDAVQKVANDLTALYTPEQKKMTQELADARGKLFGKLISYGECAIPVLENDFWSAEDSPKRIIALYGFSSILKEKALEYLFQGIQDPSRDVRIIAVFLLSPYKDDKTEDMLIEMLSKETDEAIKTLTMAAILDFNNSKALATVTSYLEDKDPKVQQAAKMLLMRFAQKKTGSQSGAEQAGSAN